jgi:hypothetical protein
MRITFNGPNNHSSEKFQYWTLLPTFDFVVDKQMEEPFYTNEGKKLGGYKEYSLGFLWLKFAFYMNIEIDKK